MNFRNFIAYPVIIFSFATIGSAWSPQGIAAGTGAGVLVSPAGHSTDRLIVKFRDTARASISGVRGTTMPALSAVAGVPLKMVRPMSWQSHILALPGFTSNEKAREIAARISADPRVEYAEPDYIAQPAREPNDFFYDNDTQWHYDNQVTEVAAANLPGAWDTTTGNPDVIVAVIDTGITEHVDIDTNIFDASGKVVPGYDFVSRDTGGTAYVANDSDGRDNDPRDPGDWITQREMTGEDKDGFFDRTPPCVRRYSSWHGTHVAGTIGANTHNGTGVAGVGWDVRIMPVRALGKCGGYTSDIVEAMLWAAGVLDRPMGESATRYPDNPPAPARVINLSLGISTSCSPAMQQTVNAVTAAGAVVVVAAGNSNTTAATTSPASCNNVITVAALDRNGARAGYSNFGTVVDIAAPGGGEGAALTDRIYSTHNDGLYGPGADIYGFLIGTSMATPHVAGVVALMLSVDPTLTPADVETVLKDNARPFRTNTGGIDCTTMTCGAGMLDAALVLNALSTFLQPDNATLAFPGTALGMSSMAQTITLTNASPDPATTITVDAVIDNTDITGTNAAEFAVTAENCAGMVLGGGDSCTIDVTFTPVGINGPRTALLTINSDAANQPTEIQLTGVGGPIVTVTASDNTATENPLTTGEFTISSDIPAPMGGLTVPFTVSGDAIAGTDYVNDLGGTATIAAATTSATITVTPLDDADPETGESVSITVSNSADYTVGNPGSASVIINSEDNFLPVASAGADQTVYINSSVTLNGTGSHDLQGSIAGYTWTELTATGVVLDLTDPSRPTFTAPAAPEIITFDLVVTDNVGATSTNTETVTITVQNPPSQVNVGGGGGGGGGCFIATAAYGSAMATEIDTLRSLRDEYLLTNDIGRLFVHVYYQYSPPLADWLKGQERLRAAVRLGLTPWLALGNLLSEEQ